MGNSGGIKEDENNKNINMNEIIENDCYEEIDLNKINKLKQREKNWNENSVIYSNNDLIEILGDKTDDQKENQTEKKIEDKNNNDGIYNKVIEEQKNEDGSEDAKDRKVIDNSKNNSKLNENNNNEEKEKKEEVKEEPKPEKKEEQNEEKKEEPKQEQKEVNNNIVNNVDNNNANSQQAEINNNVNIENKIGENNEKNNKNIENINKKEEEKNNQADNITNETPKHVKTQKRVSLKVKNLKPKIRPKNTSDAALNRSLNASPKNSHQAQSKSNFQNNKNTKKNGSNNNINQTNNNNNNNEEKPKDKGINNQIVEKKEPEEEFDIKNIISEYRLNHLKDDEIIYSGTLDKILKIPEKNTITYSQRFCIFTKNYFAYYKSKESYISLNRPMLVINNNLIIRIENTTLDGDNYYFGLICVVNDETKDIIKKVNSFVTTEGNTCELLLGFRTKQYENMMKWVIILRYFISNKNGQ